MQRLPPLNAVRTFEVAARLGSFVMAGQELGVSSAAVSQQIRHLEEYFGKKLFSRNGNRLALTDAGLAIYPQTSRALGDIAAMTVRILEGELRTRLIVSVPFSLAEYWLAPRLAQLLEVHPQLSVDVRVEDDPVDMGRHDVDLRISYGDYHYASFEAVPLFHDEVLPLCAPELWYRHGNQDFELTQVHESLFIHTHWGPNYASHPTWSDWFAAEVGAPAPDPAHGRRSGLSSLSISLARLGCGIALGQKTLARADLESGRLIALSSSSLRLGHAYCAFVPAAKSQRADVRRLLALLSEPPAPG
ncbi:LysR substrate-binding domain-containing protein [Pseudomonas sp. HR96]|uniref:LysR substrate-binding domain-containing protein n=1 Tax=Pseudomonas sp. HR96 TaxID=1027966 RepID=UPI002A757920|nr:LysR substrate-binding domain-containing protein [Pseudomonas sp. HR96]WPO99085.1 LysR substrate-binding domain-containing protein [Pseudomonas sp. HR96]